MYSMSLILGSVIISILSVSCYILEVICLNSKVWISNLNKTCGLFECCTIEKTACYSVGENDTLIWARAFYLISLITLLISIINFWMFGLRWKESFSCGYLSFFFVVASVSVILYANDEVKSLQQYEFDYGFNISCACSGLTWLICLVELAVIIKLKSNSKDYQKF